MKSDAAPRLGGVAAKMVLPRANASFGASIERRLRQGASQLFGAPERYLLFVSRFPRGQRHSRGLSLRIFCRNIVKWLRPA
jgi:hypothetical protein